MFVTSLDRFVPGAHRVRTRDSIRGFVYDVATGKLNEVL
jgi:hypothetical protein